MRESATKRLFIATWICAHIAIASKPGFAADALPADVRTRFDSSAIGDTVPELARVLPSLRGLAFSPDGKLLATRGEPADSSHSRYVHLWETATGKLIRVLKLHDTRVTSIAFSPDGRFLATGQPEHPSGAQVWDVKTGGLVSRMDGGRGRVHFLPDGNQLAIVSAFGAADVLRFHAVATGRETRRIILDLNYRFVFSPDAGRMLSLRTAGRTDLFLTDLAGSDPPKKLRGCQSSPAALAFSADARTIVAGYSRRKSHRVIVWEAGTLGIVHELKVDTGRVLASAFSGDGRFLATAGTDRSVKLWELATGKLIHSYVGHKGPVTTLAFSPDSRLLASGGLDKTVFLWDVVARVRSFLPPGPLTAEDHQQIWRDLASQSPATAYAAMGRVAAANETALAEMRKRVHGILVPSQNERVNELLAELDDDDSVVRNRATRELRKLRQVARPVLLKVFQETTSAEVRYRLRRILGRKKDEERFSQTDVRRMRRLIHIAEQTGGQNAKDILKMIIEGFPIPAAVRDAKEAIQRLNRRRE